EAGQGRAVVVIAGGYQAVAKVDGVVPVVLREVAVAQDLRPGQELGGLPPLLLDPLAPGRLPGAVALPGGQPADRRLDPAGRARAGGWRQGGPLAPPAPGGGGWGGGGPLTPDPSPPRGEGVGNRVLQNPRPEPVGAAVVARRRRAAAAVGAARG